MNANASGAFFQGLRDTKTASMRASRSETNKENRANMSSLDTSISSTKGKAAPPKTSMLKRPKTASAILESKSKEAVPDGAMVLDDLAAEEEPKPVLEGLEGELMQSDVDFDEVLAIKIKKVGKNLAADKQCMEDQKALIIKLRSALTEAVQRRDVCAKRALELNSQLEALSARMEEEVEGLGKKLEEALSDAGGKGQKIEEMEASIEELRGMLGKRGEELEEISNKLKDIQEEQAEERAASATAAVNAAAVLSHRDTLLKEGEESKKQREEEVAKMDKEVAELKQQLGQEMVSHTEFRKKFEAAQEEASSLADKSARLEGELAGAKQEGAKAAAERDDAIAAAAQAAKERESEAQSAQEAHRAEVARLEGRIGEGDAKAADLQGRMDAASLQHSDTVKSLIASQEMQSKRITELSSERDAQLAEMMRAKAEQAEAVEEKIQEKHRAQKLELDLHLADTECQRAKERCEAAEKELEGVRGKLDAVNVEKSEVQSSLAAVEAEFKVYKEQNQREGSIQEQFEQFCKLQVESQAVQAAKSATEGDLANERHLNQRLREENQAILKKLQMAEAARRKLHNEVQELKGNVRTFLRLRPNTSRGEEGSISKCPITVDPEEGLALCSLGESANSFKFDRAFGQETRQEDVFEEVRDFVQSALDGYSVSLLAYGQTGAGKTHTMIGGPADHRGLIPRSLSFILSTVATMGKDGWSHTLQASCVEIYNESIRDLLCPSSESDAKNMRIQASETYGVMNVSDLTLVEVRSVEDVERLMNMAEKHRTVKGTDMNERSSRSHTVFQLRISGERTLKSGQKQTLFGSLSLVDLAGSERLDKSGATGDRLKETQAINKSLSALADVFTAISKKQGHIPFRNSKLTHLLQPSLSGDGKALVLIAVSGDERNASESLCSLRFSSLVSQCELGKPTKNISTEGGGGSGGAPPRKVSPGKRPLTAPTAGGDKKRRT